MDGNGEVDSGYRRGIMKVTGLVVVAAICLLLAPTCDSASQTIVLQPPSGPIPLELFGMHFHRLATTTPWPTMTIGSWRLLAAYVDWPNLEPTRGKWDFKKLDSYVAMAQMHDVRLLLPLVFSPTWASARPQERSSYSPGNAAAPTDLADWVNYVRTVATRYQGRIHDYEIWNEPNVKTIFSGSVPEMVQLSKIAYETLKQVDPTVTVCSPSATHSDGVRWLDQYLEAGGGKYADVIGFHFYVDPEAPEAMVPLIRQVEQVMAKDGVANKPLWNTETGYMIQNRQSVVKAPSHTSYVVLSESLAVSYVARSYIIAWASGVSRFYWYSWDNWNLGLVDRDGRTLKLPAIAYGQLEKWLVGATMTSCGSDAQATWTCAITRRGGYHGWIIWNPSATEHLFASKLPVSWRVAEDHDLLGHESHVASGATVQISIMPHLFDSGN